MAKNYVGVPDVGGIPGLFDETVKVVPVEDGKPHRKCCGECAFKDAIQIDPILEKCSRTLTAFYCIHRDEDTHRVCAGFAAYDKDRR